MKQIKTILTILFVFLIAFNAISQDRNYKQRKKYNYKLKYKQNYTTIWYGNQNSISAEFGQNIGFDELRRFQYGFNVGGGYTLNGNVPKVMIGTHIISYAKPHWNYMWMMGFVFYNFEYFDVYTGVGVQKGRMHLVGKINLINTVSKNWEQGEIFEIGVGLSF